MLHSFPKRLVINWTIFFLAYLLVCTIPSIAASSSSGENLQLTNNIQTFDTSNIPFGPHFENASCRIRRTLGMPPFLPSTNTQVDCEAFIQAFQIFKFIRGKAHIPYISADITLEQIPKYFVWKTDADVTLEATRQSLLIGAVKGTLELNGVQSTFVNNMKNLWHAANKIADWIEHIFRKKSKEIRVRQLKNAVVRGKFFKSWEKTNFKEPIPHLPHIYEALRLRYGMAKKGVEDPSIDPEVLFQLTILTEYFAERSRGCVPSLSEVSRLSSVAVQKSSLLNKNWRRFNYWTRSGMEVAIWSAFLNKPYMTITHQEQIHFILNQQLTLDVISSSKRSLYEKFLKASTNRSIQVVWIKIYHSFWEHKSPSENAGKQCRTQKESNSENWSH